MSTELVTQNPFGTSVAEPRGAMSGVAQTKAASEMQAAVFMAKQFPRNQVEAAERILIACQRESLPTLFSETLRVSYRNAGINANFCAAILENPGRCGIIRRFGWFIREQFTMEKNDV
ncbi:MAG: hypothetical protein FWH27_12010 [Planctomycetaceae bacterium]|nr:hypothetical protein [Planctomycetaceae bacterium]